MAAMICLHIEENIWRFQSVQTCSECAHMSQILRPRALWASEHFQLQVCAVQASDLERSARVAVDKRWSSPSADHAPTNLPHLQQCSGSSLTTSSSCLETEVCVHPSDASSDPFSPMQALNLNIFKLSSGKRLLRRTRAVLKCKAWCQSPGAALQASASKPWLLP